MSLISANYTVSDSHVVDVGYVAVCTISCSYLVVGIPRIAGLVSQIPKMSEWGLLSGATSEFIHVQINISMNNTDDNVSWTPWTKWHPGQYIARKFKMQLVASCDDPSDSTAIEVRQFTWTVDMPDIVDIGTDVPSDITGAVITFTKHFQIIPNVQITILDAQQHDDVQFPVSPYINPDGTGGFTVRIVNGAIGVLRRINWLAKGY